jgi:hypothetical protein
LAEKYGISHESASAVLAALSPQKDWYQNVSLAERVINGYKKSAGKMLDADSLATAREIYSDPKFANNIEAMANMPFDELDDVQKAMYVRSLDQTHNDRGYQMINPNGDRVGQAFSDKTGKPNTTAWGSNSEIAKAIRVIEDPSIENISRQMGGAHKVRNFYNNISDPTYAIDNPELGDVTIDTHAVAADQIMPLSGNSVPVGAAFGTTKGVASSAQTGARGTYGLHADAYRIAARELGIQPRELQSVTWETVRSLFPKEFKTKGNVSEINEIWKLYNSGKLSKGLARELILDKAGGIPDPDWAAGLNTAASGPRGLGANTGELSFSGVPGGQTAGRSDAGRNLIAAGFSTGFLGALGIGYTEPAQASASDIQANQGLVPFDKDIHTPRDVGFGGPSTEYTMTVDAPDGQVAVIPSIWWDTNGEPVVLDQRDAERRSFEYEQETGKQFPRFPAGDYELADEYAQARTRQGGASESPLASEYPSLGGMGVRMPPTAEDEEAMLAPTGGDLMQQANDDFLNSIFNQPGSLLYGADQTNSLLNPDTYNLTYDDIADTSRGAFDATVGFMGDMEQMLIGGIMQGIGEATTWEDALKMISGGLGQGIINAPEGRGSRFMEGMKNYDPVFVTSKEVGEVPGVVPRLGPKNEGRTKAFEMFGGFFSPI